MKLVANSNCNHRVFCARVRHSDSEALQEGATTSTAAALQAPGQQDLSGEDDVLNLVFQVEYFGH